MYGDVVLIFTLTRVKHFRLTACKTSDEIQNTKESFTLDSLFPIWILWPNFKIGSNMNTGAHVPPCQPTH